MKVKKPNPIIYFLAYLVLMPFLKIFFRLEINRSGYVPPRNEPLLAVSNHGSFMDFAIVMLALYPRRFNAVTAQKFFYYKPLHWLLPMMGCIPKNLFDADVRAIVGIKQVLSRGDNILLFPEGRCECDGVYAGMHTATGKLVKKLGVTVVSCSVDGAYSCMPFWRKGMRFGRVRVILSDLLSAQQVKELSVEDINAAIDRRLSRTDDPAPRKPLGTKSRKRLAEGLQNIIYWCPVCNSEFTTETEGCTIHCTACNSAWRLDGALNLYIYRDENNPDATADEQCKECIMPGTLHEWFKLQAKYEANKFSDDIEPVTVKVSVRLPSDVPGGGMDTCGEGAMRMDSSGWHYDGVLRGETVSLHFPFHMVPALPIDPDDVFQIYAHGVFHCFVPARTRECVKYSVIGECAYWHFVSDTRMTPRFDSGFIKIENGK